MGLENPEWCENKYPKYLFIQNGTTNTVRVWIRKGRAWPDCTYFWLEDSEGRHQVFPDHAGALAWVHESDPEWASRKKAVR